jgi:hypothetical protein
VPVELEHFAHQAQDVGVVVDDQDPGRRQHQCGV